MKTALFGVLAGVGFTWASWIVGSQAPTAQAQIPGTAATSELIALSMPLSDRQQQVTIVDPRRAVIGVYHVDSSTGAIALRSVRNIQWDLQMTEFNAGQPAPNEVRSLIQQQQ